MGYRLGVDLGTTWTAAAVDEGGRAEPLTLGTHGWAVPSVVAVDGDQVVAGEAAARRAATDPGSAAREFKRRLGDPTPLVLRGSPYGAEALTGHLLAHVVAVATELQGAGPSKVALTHPAAWGDFKLDQLREAQRIAGLEDVELVPEPVAAAIEYVRAGRVEAGTVVAVYDFGGGTFDAAVVRADAERPELVGPAEGLERLGGVDIDVAVLAHVRQSLGDAMEGVDRTDPDVRRALARLRDECVAAKEALSSDTEASIPVDLPSLRTEVRLTRAELESMVRPRLDDTVNALRRVMSAAGVEPGNLAAVVLVGGTSRMPLVGRVLAEELNRPVLVDIDPKLVVARGAAVSGAPMEPGTAGPVGPEAPEVMMVPGEERRPSDTDRPAAAVATPPGDAPTAPPSAAGQVGRRVAAGVAVTGAAVVGTAATAAAWPAGGDGDAEPQEEAAPAGDEPVAVAPPTDESLDAMDEVAPPLPPGAAATGVGGQAVPSVAHAAGSRPSAARPETGGAQPPPATGRPDDGQAAAGRGERQRLEAFKDQLQARLENWKPPQGAEAEDVAALRKDLDDLIERFQPKPGESVDDAMAALQSQLDDRVKLFAAEEQAEDIREAAQRQAEAEQARRTDLREDQTEYNATRQALIEAVLDYRPGLPGLVDMAQLEGVKARLVEQIKKQAFNDDVPGGVIQQQQQLFTQAANELRQWEMDEYMAARRQDETELAFHRGRYQDPSTPPAERAESFQEMERLGSRLERNTNFVEARLERYQTGAGLFGNQAASKINSTFSTDEDDLRAAGFMPNVDPHQDRLPPPPTPPSPTPPSPTPPSPPPAAPPTATPTTGAAAPTPPSAATPPAAAPLAGQSLRPTVLPDAFDAIAPPLASPATATTAPPPARAEGPVRSTRGLSDDAGASPATSAATGTLGWDGRPVAGDADNLRTVAAPATGTGRGAAPVDDDDVLGVDAVRAATPATPRPATGPEPGRPDATAPAVDGAASPARPEPDRSDGWLSPDEGNVDAVPRAAPFLEPEPGPPDPDERGPDPPEPDDDVLGT